jgi:hypothetical protein
MLPYSSVPCAGLNATPNFGLTNPSDPSALLSGLADVTSN